MKLLRNLLLAGTMVVGFSCSHMNKSCCAPHGSTACKGGQCKVDKSCCENKCGQCTGDKKSCSTGKCHIKKKS